MRTPSQQPTPRRRRGAVSIVVLSALIVLLGAVALSIDNGLMLTTRVQLQNAADAAALAAMSEVRGGLLQSEAINAAIDIAGLHRAGGDPVEIEAGDIEFGSFDYLTGSFTPGGLGGISAVRVTARRTDGAPGGPLDLFFAPLLGKDTANVRASSVAGIGTRDIVMAQDISRSFFEMRADAIDALDDFSTLMSDQSVAGDRLGLVSFNEDSNVVQPLSVLPDELSAVTDAVAGLDSAWCSLSPPFGFPCNGTHIGAGVDASIDTLLAQEQRDGARVIVLLSDGVPCALNDPVTTQQRVDSALAARDRAENEGISIFAIYFEVTTNPAMLCQGVPINPDFMQQMTSGFGQYFETPNSDELDEILTSILTETPLRVVK